MDYSGYKARFACEECGDEMVIYHLIDIRKPTKDRVNVECKSCGYESTLHVEPDLPRRELESEIHRDY